MLPLLWAYMALMAASTAASGMSQRKVNKSRAHAMAEDRARRTLQQKQSEASAESTLKEYSGSRQKEDARSGELANAYKSESQAPTTSDAGTRFLENSIPHGSTETVNAISDARSQAHAASDARTAKFAKLGAYGDVNAANALLAARNQQDIGLSQNMYQGWQSNVLPAVLAKANTDGRQWSTAADVMKLAASIMGPFALSGGNAAANSTEGVLDKMSGVPKEFAGKDLFGMGEKFGEGLPFNSPQAIGEVIPTAGLIGSGTGGLAGGIGNTFAQNPKQMEALRKMWARGMGALTPEELALIGRQF